MPLTREQAAIILQKNIRMWKAKKTYGVETNKYNPYANTIYLIGNDPQMPVELDAYTIPDDNIAVIGTGGLRNLAIACKLGNKTLTPKLIIVDIATKVCEFWRELREIMLNDRNTAALTPEAFLVEFEALARRYDKYVDYAAAIDKQMAEDHKNSTYIKSHPVSYMHALFNKYGYAYTRAIILNTSVIGNSWSSEKNTQKIKHILDHLGIKNVFVFVSNIYFVMHKNEGDALLKAIQSLEPNLTIQTNRCFEHKKPSKVMLFTPQHSQEEILATLQNARKCPNDPATNAARFMIDLRHLNLLSQCFHLNEKDVLTFILDHTNKNHSPTSIPNPYDLTKQLIRHFNLDENLVRMYVEITQKEEMRSFGIQP